MLPKRLQKGDTIGVIAPSDPITGEKKEEYREIKPYYDSRFMNIFGFDYLNKRVEIVFRNGYSANSPSIKCLCILNKGYGKQKWGAEIKRILHINHT